MTQDFSLKNIALSFSGGGYRAAAFHFGVLDFLHQIGLLDQVTMLSTVSGGSLTGAKYVLALSQDPQKANPDFYLTFYNTFHLFLQKQRLPDCWLEQLQSYDVPQPQTFNGLPRPLSLTQTAARTYAQPIEDGGLVGMLRLGDIKKVQAQCHLKEIIFNTTELNTGLNFRFRIGDGGRIGNGTFPLQPVIANQVCLADVVAASSCFPGGFEPLLFPQDFQWPQPQRSTIIDQVRSKLLGDDLQDPKQEKTLPLMDGGIYDNLGIDALRLADERIEDRCKAESDPIKRQEIAQQRIGTLIISDTDNIGLDNAALNQKGEKAPLFKVPASLPRHGLLRIKLRWVAGFIPVLFTMLLVSTIGLGVGTLYAAFVLKHWGLGLLGGWITLIMSGIVMIFGWLSDAVRAWVAPQGNYAPDGAKSPTHLPGMAAVIKPLQNIILNWQQLLSSIGNLEIADAINLVNIRLVSLSSLFIVFLSNQRRQSHKLVYDSAVYQDQTISCFMYDIPKALRALHRKLQKQPMPTGASTAKIKALNVMAEIADEATRMPTTLWFDRDNAAHQLDTLIACGQFTMCFNLLKHLDAKGAKVKLSPETQQLYDLALIAWQEFERNPRVWVGESRQQAQILWEQQKQKP